MGGGIGGGGIGVDIAFVPPNDSQYGGKVGSQSSSRAFPPESRLGFGPMTVLCRHSVPAIM